MAQVDFPPLNEGFSLEYETWDATEADVESHLPRWKEMASQVRHETGGELIEREGGGVALRMITKREWLLELDPSNGFHADLIEQIKSRRPGGGG